MASIIEFYHKANARALDRWNGGEGTILGTQCKAELQRYQVSAVLSVDLCSGLPILCRLCVVVSR